MSYIYQSFLITVVVGGLLIIALLSRKHNRLPNLLLSAILGIAIFFQYVVSLKVTGEISQYAYLWRSLFPLSVMVNTLLYLYVLALTVPGFKISQLPRTYYLPLVFALLWYGVLQLVPRTSPLWVDQDWILGERYIRACFAFIVKSFFLFLCFYQIHRYRKYVKLYFSELRHVRLRWLENLLIIFTIPWLLRGLDIISGPYLMIEKFSLPIISFCVLLIGFLGLRQSTIFSSEEASVEEIFSYSDKAAKKSELLLKSKKEIVERDLIFFTEEELAEWKTKLEAFMAQEKPYLKPELRLMDLAKGLGIKGYQVSEILNRGMGESFYSYINRHRIDEAKNRLTDPHYEHLNILGIANDSGFNSKSVFNEVFRKVTGTTPSEFRKCS